MLKHIPFYASLLGQPINNTKKATHGHVLVYGAIEAHSMGDKGCIASNKLISLETGLTQGSVATIISSIAKAGWISVHLTSDNKRLGITPLMIIALPSTPIEPPSTPIEGTLQPGLNIEDSKKTVKSMSAKKKALAAKEKELLPLYLDLAETMGYKRSRVKPTKMVHLIARLKDFTEEEVRRAATNLSQSSFHMGDNDRGTKFATMEFLLRDNEKVEKWMSSSPAKSNKGNTVSI